MSTTTTSHVLTPLQLSRIRRERHLATTAGIAGAIVSGAANLIASDGGPIGWAVAAVAPAAFVLAAELATSGSMHTTAERVRSTVAAAIALAAAVVSFGHIREVVLEVGESGLASVLIPFVIDALVLTGLVTNRTTAGQLQRHEAASIEAPARPFESSSSPALPPGEFTNAIPSPSISTNGSGARNGSSTPGSDDDASPSHRSESRPSPEQTRARRDADPHLTRAELAAELGISTKTVQRHLKATDKASA